MAHNRISFDERTGYEIARDYARSLAILARDVFGAGCLLIAVIGAYGWWNG